MRERVENWEKKHLEIIEKHNNLPSQYGISDCFIFPDDNHEALTGEKIHGEIFRTYKTEIGGAKKLRKWGCQNVEELFALKLEKIPVSMAQRGDIGVVERNGVISGGVFTSVGFAVKSDFGQITYLPVSEVKTAFKVG